MLRLGAMQADGYMRVRDGSSRMLLVIVAR
jgi:hypothetical protein